MFLLNEYLLRAFSVSGIRHKKQATVPIIRAPNQMGDKHGDKLQLRIPYATIKVCMKCHGHIEEKSLSAWRLLHRGGMAPELELGWGEGSQMQGPGGRQSGNISETL